MTDIHINGPDSGPEAAYLGGLAQGRWCVQHCSDCAQFVFPPRQFCPRCEGSALEWREPDPVGTVYSSTVVRLDPKQPYNVALIDLDAGVRMMANVVGIDSDAVRIGMRVSGAIEQSGAEARIVFHPVRETQNEG